MERELKCSLFLLKILRINLYEKYILRLYIFIFRRIYIMPKDSQPDNKQARMEKCNYQTPITEEGHNHNPNAKHKSIKREGVSSQHYNPAGN